MSWKGPIPGVQSKQYSDLRVQRAARKRVAHGERAMMNGSMMWGMGLVSILVIVVLILAVAALIKYLFFSGRE